MNRLSDFFVTFCVSAILIGTLLIICPNGKLSKSVKYILGLSFTLIIISSALKINFNFQPIAEADTAVSYTDSLSVNSAEYVYGECLKASNIEFSKISVLTNKTTDNRIVISKVIIYSKEDKNKILSALNEVAQNFEVEIINE